ncbi:hypothetical protein [Thermoactinomyces sp. DSM 45892]|uniref:hypothetical protein n=1 Tax=Thermoactinomyces sp. DSM 45892 TaxID=1882753 RepID=UPI000898EE23|nr:hypothetical protein [Thermoactinomyces sp. DSM 45892]SDZ05684.1 hypothetical protein SAMN05444416_112105 [Thermoactinomyces sp. DSM 45892]
MINNIVDALYYKDLTTLTTTEINKLAFATQSDIKRLKREGKQVREENFTLPMWYILEVFRKDMMRLYYQHGLYFNRTRDEHGETAFERRLKEKLLTAAERYNGKYNFSALVSKAFRQATGEYYQRRTAWAKDEFSYDDVTEETDMKVRKKTTMYISDRHENVEKTIVGEEMVQALFARYGKCSRRNFILRRLYDPDNPTNVAVARDMSIKFGTKEESNKKFIQRFKLEAQAFICKEYEDRLVA